MKQLKLHILKGSQVEHDKLWKEFAYLYGHDHPRTKVLEKEVHKLVDEINKLSKEK
jgi:hypothetical protein